MPTSILVTKLLTPPTRTDCVIRQRLHQRLDQGVLGRLTLISAPAGFGKTTLLTSWLNTAGAKASNRKVAWLSLEDDDNTPGRFLSYLIAALQTVDPRIGAAAKTFAEVEGTVDVGHAVTLLVQDLAKVSESTVLVLDDFHVITRADLQRGVAKFVEHLPSTLHLVIATRHEPNLQLPRLRARNEIVEVRMQDLRLTGDETSEFLKRTMDLSLPNDAAHVLEERTDGWVAGLQMAALSLRGHAGDSNQDYKDRVLESLCGDQRDILDYLATEVLRQQTAEIRDFLRRTAILDRFNASLCDAVCERGDSQNVLAQLERANLFLFPLDQRRQWYRYHHLFADFLRGESNEADQAELHRRASAWHATHGRTEDAIKHALAAKDYEAAAKLISRGVDERIPHGEFNTILDWINALPEKVLRSHIDLLVQKGWILYMRGDAVTGAAYAALATESVRKTDSPIHRGTLLSFRADLAMHQGNVQQAVKFGEEALRLFGDDESFHRTIALSHLGQAERLCGNRIKAIETLRKAMALGRRLGHHESSLESLGWLSRLLSQQGKLREAIVLCENAIREHNDARGNPLPMLCLVYVPLGMLCYEANDLTRARGYLMTSMTLWEQMKFYPASLALRTLAKLYFAEGDTEAAFETLAAGRALAMKSENQQRIRLANAVSAELQLRQGLVEAAAITAASLPESYDERTEYENLLVSRLMLGQGKLNESRRLLQRLEESASQQGRFGSLVAIYVRQAVTQQAAKQTRQALEYLEKAVSLAAIDGYRRAFLDSEPIVEPLLCELPKVAPAFVTSLIEGFRQQAGCSQSKPETATVDKSAKSQPLTKTQVRVLRLVGEGLSNRDIAAKMSITPATAKAHLSQIYGKLDVSSRTQALARARQLGLL